MLVADEYSGVLRSLIDIVEKYLYLRKNEKLWDRYLLRRSAVIVKGTKKFNEKSSEKLISQICSEGYF